MVALDLSNTDPNKQRNKLGNSGFSAILEGMLCSKNSLIAFLSVQGNSITDLTLLKEVLE